MSPLLPCSPLGRLVPVTDRRLFSAGLICHTPCACREPASNAPAASNSDDGSADNPAWAAMVLGQWAEFGVPRSLRSSFRVERLSGGTGAAAAPAAALNPIQWLCFTLEPRTCATLRAVEAKLGAGLAHRRVRVRPSRTLSYVVKLVAEKHFGGISECPLRVYPSRAHEETLPDAFRDGWGWECGRTTMRDVFEQMGRPEPLTLEYAFPDEKPCGVSWRAQDLQFMPQLLAMFQLMRVRLGGCGDTNPCCASCLCSGRRHACAAALSRGPLTFTLGAGREGPVRGHGGGDKQ